MVGRLIALAFLIPVIVFLLVIPVRNSESLLAVQTGLPRRGKWFRQK